MAHFTVLTVFEILVIGKEIGPSQRVTFLQAFAGDESSLAVGVRSIGEEYPPVCPIEPIGTAVATFNERVQ